MVGDCNISKPGMTDVKGKAKWEAWNGKKESFKYKKLDTNMNLINQSLPPG